jgi:signal peptidase II
VNKIIIIVFLLIFDLISKQIIYYSIDLNSFLTITSFLDVAHIHNFGISFGFFSGIVSPWIFILVGIIVTGFIFYMLIKSTNHMEKWGLTVIIAGALSNIADRGLNGYVTDFIYLHYQDFYWPAFNFADIYISVGICVIVLHLLRDLNKRFK